jgi:hypothetical protein
VARTKRDRFLIKDLDEARVFCNGTDIGWYLDDVEVYECR